MCISWNKTVVLHSHSTIINVRKLTSIKHYQIIYRTHLISSIISTKENLSLCVIFSCNISFVPLVWNILVLIREFLRAYHPLLKKEMFSFGFVWLLIPGWILHKWLGSARSIAYREGCSVLLLLIGIVSFDHSKCSVSLSYGFSFYPCKQ